jgi:hypothetical protein
MFADETLESLINCIERYVSKVDKLLIRFDVSSSSAGEIYHRSVVTYVNNKKRVKSSSILDVNFKSLLIKTILFLEDKVELIELDNVNYLFKIKDNDNK